MKTAARSSHEIVRRHAKRHDDSRAVIGTDDSGSVVYWNRAAEELYGWSEAEVLGRNIIDVTPALVSRRDAERIMHQLLAGKCWSGEFLVHHRDGTVLSVHVDDEPVIADGVVVGVVGISSCTRRSGQS